MYVVAMLASGLARIPHLIRAARTDAEREPPRLMLIHWLWLLAMPALELDAALRDLALRAGAVLALAVLALLALAESTELRGELAFARFYRMSELAERPLYTGDAVRRRLP